MTSDQVASIVELDIEALLRAGYQYLPDKAEILSAAAADLASCTAVLNTQSAKASDPPSMVDLLGINDILFEAVRRCVLTMNDAAQGLVAVVQDFVETDDIARERFSGMQTRLPALTAPHEVALAPVPPPADDAGAIGASGVTPR